MAFVASLRDRNELPLLRGDDFTDEILTDLAGAVLEVVAEKRATFTRANMVAEIHRQLHGVRFASPGDWVATGERTR